jgi:hypothetical protein
MIRRSSARRARAVQPEDESPAEAAREVEPAERKGTGGEAAKSVGIGAKRRRSKEVVEPGAAPEGARREDDEGEPLGRPHEDKGLDR